MPFLPWLKQLFTVDDSVMNDQFTLTPTETQRANSAVPSSEQGGQAGTSNKNQADDRSAAPSAVHSRANDQTEEPMHDDFARRPIPLGELVLQAEQKREQGADTTQPDSNGIPIRIEDIKQKLEKTFYLPQNKDIVIREFTIGAVQPWKAMAVFVDGLSDKNIINSNILQPLMVLAHLSDEVESGRFDIVHDTLLPGNQIDKQDHWKEMIAGILTGSTGVFIDGVQRGLIVESKGWEHRTVGLAQTETVVRGPHDAFTENLRANTGLVRSRLRSEHLVTEMIPLGRLGRTDIAVMHVEGLTNPSLVAEVRRRLEAIDVDFIADSGLIEQFIEDAPLTWVPQVMSTERPDRIAHMLSEGHVAIFVGNSPFVLGVPVVLWTLMQTAEDAYVKFPFGTFLRTIRWAALLAAILMPGFYIAVTNYHPEMIPTDLLLAIAGSREQVPFPVIVEVLLMEFSIELIREAGIRIPSVIGPTIGIVGALILGQAAVQAGVVSPLLVIVIAVTALSSFTVPNYNLSFAVRVGRFLFLLAAAMFGFYGIALLLLVIVVKLSMHKSFGVPFLSPVVPSSDSSPDVFTRGPSYRMNQRPDFLMTQQSWRQEPVTRTWSKTTQQGMNAGKRRKRGKS